MGATRNGCNKSGGGVTGGIARLIASLVLAAACAISFAGTALAATSTDWAWPTYVHSLKGDWPAYLSSGKFHGGTDFAVPEGTPVYSSCDGVVVTAQTGTGSYDGYAWYGKCVVVEATVNGQVVYIHYCHLSDYSVSVGDTVKAGQRIATSGNLGNTTGPHLHYEVNVYSGGTGSLSLSTCYDPSDYLPGSSYAYETNGPVPTYEVDHSFDGCYPIYARTVSTGRVSVYSAPGASSPEADRYIDGAKDDPIIQEVYTNGWCKVDYPSGSTRRVAYVPTSEFGFTGSAGASVKPTSGKMLYCRASGAGDWGNLHAGGEDIRPISSTTDRSCYLVSIGGNWHLGFTDGPAYVADTTAPVISNVRVTDVDENGYTVTCTATDPSGVARVEFPTWTPETGGGFGQDDILWGSGTRSGDTWTYRVKYSDHGGERGIYYTHVYATDAVGNKTPVSASVAADQVMAPSAVARYGDHTYYLVEHDATWEQARDWAGYYAPRGRLVSVGSPGEQELVESLVARSADASRDHYWLGGSDAASEGEWTWQGGGFWTYDNWWPGEPNGGTAENYVALVASDGTWIDLPNSGRGLDPSRMGYVVEVGIDSAVPVSEATVVVGGSSYTGDPLEPEVSVVLGTRTLVLGTDYTVSCSNNVNAGTATVTVTGKGGYAGTKTATFEISPADLSAAFVSVLGEGFAYEGSPVEPGVEVALGGKALVEGADYAVSYSGNAAPGTAIVTVTGRGNYTGTATATFEIAAPAPEPPSFERTPEGYAKMLYAGLLEREPSEAGVAYWAEKLGADGAAAVAEMSSGQSFATAMAGRTSEQAARALYAGLLGNLEPSQAQVSYWAGVVASKGAAAAAREMASGEAFAAVAEEFGLGPDGRVYARTPRGYAEMLYNRLIDVQAPEPYRLDWWEARLFSTSDPAGAVASFAASNAFGDMGYSPREAAAVLYSAILDNTSPSAAQLDYWQGRVSAVGPVAAAAEMTDSAAFRGACAEYGLGAGFEPPAARDYARTPRGYAEMLYNRLIDVPDPSAQRLDWWEGELFRGDPAAVVASFASSGAFGNMGYTDREAARVLYSAILDNLYPTDFQLDWWQGRVAEVGPVAAAAEMTDSAAFRAAVSEYGLGRGRASLQAEALSLESDEVAQAEVSEFEDKVDAPDAGETVGVPEDANGQDAEIEATEAPGSDEDGSGADEPEGLSSVEGDAASDDQEGSDSSE